MKRTPQQYTSPYVAGVGVGLVLLASFVVFGRGLGASGAFASVLEFDAPLGDWLVIEILGVFIGGFISAYFAGRLRRGIERGQHVTDRSRLVIALGGGAIMGVGARLARGCTSGLGLTGGALLSVGSWLFILAAFAAGYAVAPLVRKAWQ